MREQWKHLGATESGKSIGVGCPQFMRGRQERAKFLGQSQFLPSFWNGIDLTKTNRNGRSGQSTVRKTSCNLDLQHLALWHSRAAEKLTAWRSPWCNCHQQDFDLGTPALWLESCVVVSLLMDVLVVGKLMLQLGISAGLFEQPGFIWRFTVPESAKISDLEEQHRVSAGLLGDATQSLWHVRRRCLGTMFPQCCTGCEGWWFLQISITCTWEQYLCLTLKMSGSFFHSCLPQGELEAITEFAHVQKMQDAGSWMPVCSWLHKDHGLRTWKWMVGILISFWDGLFLGAMLVSGRVWHAYLSDLLNFSFRVVKHCKL